MVRRDGESDHWRDGESSWGMMRDVELDKETWTRVKEKGGERIGDKKGNYN